MLVSANRPLRHVRREDSGGKFQSLLTNSVYPLVTTPSWKNVANLYKRKNEYIIFYLWKFLLPLLFSSSHFVFRQRHVHQHREPEKSKKSFQPIWKLNFPFLHPILQISDCSLSLSPCKEAGLKLLYCSEVSLLRNLLWQV